MKRGGNRRAYIRDFEFGALSASESCFVSEARRRGFSIYRSGWPDFLIERRGVFYFVEVKGGNDGLNKAQVAMHDALKRLGVSVVLVRGHNFPCEIKTIAEEG